MMSLARTARMNALVFGIPVVDAARAKGGVAYQKYFGSWHDQEYGHRFPDGSRIRTRISRGGDYILGEVVD